ncbi:sugar ABC transporter permease [Treponema parvum]|uniref:Sugar ABC transporter permease n=1 Tax=Treponema parvum TaxID=138851 RepID=A0A975IF98_9SPIR|nr:sugar ABC transporter permease [Treponema parvum]QTQ14910.1 sugar ABC transporter permease [Treponema parvum]
MSSIISGKKKSIKPEYIAAAIFLLPNLSGFLVFTVWPLIYSLILSFMDWGILNKPTFIGVNNYIDIAKDGNFWICLRNTALYSFIKVPLNLFFSLLLAILLNKALRARNFFRTVAFLPAVCSSVAVGVIWQPLLESSGNGLVNHILGFVGISPIPFLSSTAWAMPSVIFVGIWKELGYFMVIYLAGLQGLPKTYYEAAAIDGSGAVNTFFKITLPLLAPTTFFAFVTSLIGSFQIFDLTSVLTNGGPANATNTLVMYIYQNGFKWFRMGYASAIALILFLIIFAVTMIQNKIVNNGAVE